MLNCKVRCVHNASTCFTVGKIYNVVDGKIKGDYGDNAGPFESIKALNNGMVSRFELYEEPQEEKSDFYSYWANICKINEHQESKGKSKYGESLEENTTLSTIQRIEHLQEELIDGLKYAEHLKLAATDTMSANDYQRMASRTAGEENREEWLLNAALGLSGESGEVADIIKKYRFHGHELNLDELKKELGDCCWYIALFCTALKIDLQEVMEGNIEKLKKRYPDGFDKSRSINRVENKMADDVADKNVGEIDKTCDNCLYCMEVQPCQP